MAAGQRAGPSANRAITERADRFVRQASLLIAQGRYAQAEPLQREASTLLVSVYGPAHPRYAESLNQLALTCAATKRFAEAATLYQQVSDIARVAVGEDHPLYQDVLVKLGLAHRASGRIFEAEQAYRQALKRQSKSRAKDPAAMASLWTDLACIYGATKRVPEALSALADAEEARDQMIAQAAARGSARDQAACVESIRAGYFLFLSLCFEYFPDSWSAHQLLLRTVLRRKALGIELSLARRISALGEKIPSVRPRLEALRLLRQQIAGKSMTGFQADTTQDPLYRDRLNQRCEQRILESDLARDLSDVCPFELYTIDTPAVASVLSPNSALVEFVKFRRYDLASFQCPTETIWLEYRYATFVLSASGNVTLLDLGPAAAIDRLINRYRSSMSRASLEWERGLVTTEEAPETDLTADGMALRAAVFDPLKKYLYGVSDLILAPDGELTRLPFETLPLDDRNRYLIDEYRIHYVDTGRELLPLHGKINGVSSPPLVVADPDFDLVGKRAGPRIQSWLQSIFRSGSRTSSARKALKIHKTRLPKWHFERLPGTYLEGKLIAGILGVPLRHGKAALESTIKKRSSPRILHLATHGFFLLNPPWATDPDEPHGKPAPHAWNFEDPLSGSGLALAGANHVLSPELLPEAAGSGVLTAEAVAGLDLENTELVVLSACETGLGQVAIGEGVLGLRRAFILAGARTLVMSLWKVGDLPTAFLMERFYHNLIRARMNRDDALREAQQYVRRLTIAELRARIMKSEVSEYLAASDPTARAVLEHDLAQPDDQHPFEHPYYWGGFILLGEKLALKHTKKELGGWRL